MLEKISEGMYRVAVKKLAETKLTWRDLAIVDSNLVEKFVNSEHVRGHSIPLDCQVDDKKVTAIHDFLSGEYDRLLKTFSLKIASYLPATNCSPLGVFSKQNLDKGVCIEGLTGCLCELPSEEIKKDYNDFSLISSKMSGKQWLMLGTISFVNHSCAPNVRYQGKINNDMHNTQGSKT